MTDAVSSTCQSALGFTVEIYDLVQKTQHREIIGNQIMQKTEDIQLQLQKIANHSDDQFTTDMETVLEEVYDRLRTCKVECEKLQDQSSIKKLPMADSNKETLKLVQTELEHVHVNLENQVICAMSFVKVQVKDGIKEVRRDCAGVYPVSSGDLKPPAAVSKPVVDFKGEQMIVSWEDDDNPPDSLVTYEVRTDDSNNDIIEVRPRYKCISIGPPKIEPGMLYTIQVRGVNGKGPGEWSEQLIVRYKTAPPRRPDKPKVFPTSINAKISVRIPGIQEAHGAPVSEVIVEYCQYNNGSKWNSETISLEEKESEHIRESVIYDLSPNTRYFFRIILINKSGQSAPSESVDVTTDVPIPGEPTNIRPSSYFTSNSIKIRWDPPEEYPESVDHYEVQYKRRKEFDSKVLHKVIKTTKLSAKAKNLKSDTWYVFHVKAVNKKGESGKAARIEAETRWKKATKAALSPFVFIGTTVAGPLIGGYKGGVIGAESRTRYLPDSTAGSVAGAVGGAIGGGLLGTVGAPVIGAACAHKFVHGSSDQSDQSDESDDEN